MPEQADPQAKQGEVAELLRAALEKIVYFEWRLSELSAELAATGKRCANAEAARAEAEEHARAAERSAQSARRQLGELEAERARLATLLARPTHVSSIDTQALEAERARGAQLEAELADARTQLDRNRAERERWMAEMIEQAQRGGEAPAALAQFISELRGEVIALREQNERARALLEQHGLAPQAPPAAAQVTQPAPSRPPEAVEEARRMLAEGRLAPPATAPSPDGGEIATEGAAARALAEQCLRGLASGDAARRAQAARHLAAIPVPAAAARLASALNAESEPRVRAQLARALAACGGETALALVEARLAEDESALVRLAALDAICAIADRAAPALAVAAKDTAPAVRRRAASLAATGLSDRVLALLSADADESVRAACALSSAPAGTPPPSTPAPARVVPAPTAAAPARVAPSPGPGEEEALLAVQAAMFGLTEDELARSTGLDAEAARALAARLVAEGRLGRRGKRLVVAEGGVA